jgi:hypothetical protein
MCTCKSVYTKNKPKMMDIADLAIQVGGARKGQSFENITSELLTGH